MLKAGKARSSELDILFRLSGLERVLILALAAKLAKLTALPRLSGPTGYCSMFSGEFSTRRERGGEFMLCKVLNISLAASCHFDKLEL